MFNVTLTLLERLNDHMSISKLESLYLEKHLSILRRFELDVSEPSRLASYISNSISSSTRGKFIEICLKLFVACILRYAFQVESRPLATVRLN